ncbi:MAG: holo-ACP synthase, partial [Methanobacteriota archaeon]
ELGKPFVNIYGKAQEIFKDCHIHISLSHNQSQAVAFVVVEK